MQFVLILQLAHLCSSGSGWLREGTNDMTASRNDMTMLSAHPCCLCALRGGGGSAASEKRRLRRAAAGVTVASEERLPSLSPDSVHLNKRIEAAIDEEALCALILQRHLDFDASNTATAYRILLMRQYLKRSVLLAASSTGRPTRSALEWRQSGSGQPRRASPHSLESCTALVESAATRKMRAWEPCQSVSILYAAARSKQKRSPNLTDLILPALVLRMTANAATVCNFTPDQISQTLWSFATLGVDADGCLLASLTTQALAVKNDFTPKDISNTLWALAMLGLQNNNSVPDRELVVAMTERAKQVQHIFKHQASANIVWALKTLGHECHTTLGHECHTDLTPCLQQRAALARNTGEICLS